MTTPKILDAVELASVDIPAIITDAKGQAAVNLMKYAAKWGWFPPDKATSEFPLPLAANLNAYGEATSLIERPGLQGGDVEIMVAMATSDGLFSVVPYSQSLNIELANNPIASTLIFGKSAFGGGPLPVSHYEPGTGAIVWKCTNMTALANDVRIVPGGRRFMSQEAQDTVEARRAKFLTTRLNSFWLAPDEGPEVVLPANGTLELHYTIPSIGDFLAIVPLSDDANEDATALASNAYTGNIQDGLTGYTLAPFELPWNDFMCQPSMRTINENFRAAPFEGPFGGIFTHIFARSSQVVEHLTNTTAKNILIRHGYRGILIRYKPAEGRNTNTSAQVRADELARAVPAPYRNIVGK